MTPDSLHVGITGTRHPLKTAQLNDLEVTLAWLAFGNEDEIHLHHGVCTGTDEAAHRIAREGGGWIIHGHPGHGRDGTSPWRAPGIYRDCDRRYPERPYYLRNRDIVAACSILVAAPLHPADDPRSARSGTWQTVSYARDRGNPKRVILVWPDGTAEDGAQ